MKEDILEQVVDDWFLSQEGTFTKHNIKYKPSPDHPDYKKSSDIIFSDIDIVAVHMREVSFERVSAASCKSTQYGFNPKFIMNSLLEHPDRKYGGREIWKSFRELITPKWGQAFAKKIYDETNSEDFTYYLFVTKILFGKEDSLLAAKEAFQNCSIFLGNLKLTSSSNVKIKLMSFEEIIKEHFLRKTKTTLEATEIGRLLQLFRASDIEFK